MADSYQAQLFNVGWTLCVFSIIITVARCYCRIVVKRNLGWDDFFMILAALSGIACVSLVSVAMRYGFGVHMNAIHNSVDREEAVKYNLLAPCLSIVSSTFSKISMVVFCLKMVGQSSTELQRWIVFTTLAAMIVLNVFIITILIAFCQPVEKSWKPQIAGKCLPNGVMSIGGGFQAVCNAVMDLVTAAFPVYMIHNLQMKRSTKWGLSFLMTGGLFGSIATIMKITKMEGLAELEDITSTWGPIALWYMVEIYVLSNIAGSLPTLRPLWTLSRKAISMLSGSEYSKKGSKGLHDQLRKSSQMRKGRVNDAPGSVTIALRDIDEMTNREHTGSTNSILPENPVSQDTLVNDYRLWAPQKQRHRGI